jgi:hypothetical protein
MSVSGVVSIAHTCAALLLFGLAVTSILLAVLIAVKPAADSANAGLVKRANSVGLIEHFVLGFVALTGVIAVFMGPWSFSEFWLWSSLVVVVFYGLALIFITKPARQIVSDGGNEVSVGMQVNLQTAHVLLLLVVFASMLIKPT